MTDIVERLRQTAIADFTGPDFGDGMNATGHLIIEAADEIDRLRQACDGYLGELAAMRENKDAEIERLTGEASHWMDEAARLQNMKANLHGHIKRLEDENTKLRTENAKLREALRALWQIPVSGGIVAHPNDMAKAIIKARAALQKDEGK